MWRRGALGKAWAMWREGALGKARAMWRKGVLGKAWAMWREGALGKARVTGTGVSLARLGQGKKKSHWIFPVTFLLKFDFL